MRTTREVISAESKPNHSAPHHFANGLNIASPEVWQNDWMAK